MLVRIVKDWTYPKSFFGQTPNSDGRWEDVQFTEEKVEQCDFLIVLQRPPYKISCACPEGNAWLITQEPPVSYFDFFKRSFKHFDRVYSYYDEAHPDLRRIQPVLPWHLLKDYTFLISLDKSKLAQKRESLVWISSNKKGFPGQTARMAFHRFLELSGFGFNMYGRGFEPIHDKFDALFPSKYALAIENFETEDYWTEKLADAFLSWCLPFYWGAPNIANYFPEESFIRIDINKPEAALNTIKAAMAGNEWEKRLNAIAEARERVLNQFQFFPYVSKMVRERANVQKEIKFVERDIPANPFPIRYRLINSIKYYSKRLLIPGK